MASRHLVLAAGSVAVLFGGCDSLSEVPEGRDDAVLYQLSPETMDILEHADHVEVLALGERIDEGAPRAAEVIDDRPIVGRADLTARRAEVPRALYRAMSNAWGEMLCFMPHHALRVRSGRRSVEIVICYTCLLMQVTGEGEFIEIDPEPLSRLLDPALAAQAGIRLESVPGEHSPRWQPAAAAGH